MSIPAEALLVGPRGRRLCLSVACALHESVWAAWLGSARHPSDERARADLIAVLHDVDPSPVRSWASVESFTGPLGDSVDAAMYWQPPDDQDVVAARPDVVDALRPVAAAVAAAPGAQWWTSSMDPEHQRCADLHHPGVAADPPDADPPGVQLAAWRARTVEDGVRARAARPHDPAANHSGEWWSIPASSGLVRTTRALPASGSVRLLWEEDGLGQEEATLWPARLTRSSRVYEVDGPASWVELVRRYPLDVSWARRHDWFKVTGRAGTWLIPDWRAVGQDWDAVHLTVLGYLSTATTALPLDEDAATLLGGFSPDETWWLTDCIDVDLSRPEHWTMTAGTGTPDVEWERRAAE